MQKPNHDGGQMQEEEGIWTRGEERADLGRQIGAVTAPSPAATCPTHRSLLGFRQLRRRIPRPAALPNGKEEEAETERMRKAA